MSVSWITADVFDGLATIPTGSVDLVVTSPPYWRKRAYTDNPKEIGQEPSPGEYLASLLRVTDELWRVVKDTGTIWFVIGDTAAGSGGPGGDVARRKRGKGRHWNPTSKAVDTPLAKSVCWLPDLFGASLAYGRNLLTGDPCQQWITRPPVTWCKPNPFPGEIRDKFREATELVVWAAKQSDYYFNLDKVRLPNSGYHRESEMRYNRKDYPGQRPRMTLHTTNPLGTPPKNWWVVPTEGHDEHAAVYPGALISQPVAACLPPGRSVILDPFAGSGTTLAVALGHNPDALAIGIDLDERNEVLARDRVGPLLWVTEGSK